jgi:hypothetical protein
MAAHVRRRALVRADRLAVGLLVLLVATGVAMPAPAGAATSFPFAFLVEDGVELEAFTDIHAGSTGFRSANRNIYAIVNGQKTSTVLGTATIIVWNRTVPDPFFGVFGPIAGLGILHFPAPFNLKVHLGLFQDSSGSLQTTIAAVNTLTGAADSTVRGTWVIANGPSVGGDANDLVIGGAWVAGVASRAGSGAIPLIQYFPTVPFPSDPTPTTTHCIELQGLGSCGKRLGSFYGYTVFAPGGPSFAFRSYTMIKQGGAPDAAAHLLVGDLGGGTYVVVACSGANPGDDCTVSGTGPIPGLVTGSAFYGSAGLDTNLNLTLFLVFP